MAFALTDDEEELDWAIEPDPADPPPVPEERTGSIQDILDQPLSDHPVEEIVEDEFERSWEDLLSGSLAPGDLLADKYLVEELIGYGAMGFVLKARHVQLDELVAVKFLLPELAQSEEALVRFEREARAAFKIRSEHVARVLDVGRLESGQPFMVMEYLEGIELGEKLYDQQMNIEELLDYMLQACDAMAAAHALDIVHRDVKPDNLFLTQRRDGSTSVKVLDFGLSKVVRRSDDDKRQKAITADAQVLGTAHYMSPEQWTASKDVGHLADIWALGVIMYEGITGESPFMRNNLAAMCNAVLREEPPAMSTFRDDVPEGLEEVVGRCMAKKPEDRYPDATELANDLLHFVSSDTRPPARFSTVPPPSPSRSSRNTVEATASAPSISAPRAPFSSPLSGQFGDQPRLGLIASDGTIDTWAEVLESADDGAGPRTALYIGVVAAAVIGALYFLI